MGTGPDSIILITGGGRSGKSRHALRLGAAYKRKAFVATGLDTDNEMRVRIERHQAERGPSWQTFEEPENIVELLRNKAAHFDLFLLDCLTFWVSNLVVGRQDDEGILQRISELKAHLVDLKSSIVIVSNEVGMGVIPENALARRFRDLAGIANQEIAEIADHVVLMVAGIPVELK